MRAETGRMQFGDDWDGVFIRGDNFAGLILNLKEVLEKSKASPLVKAQVKAYLGLFSEPQEGPSPIQKMKPFEECLAKEE